jgi:uncharacterized protein
MQANLEPELETKFYKLNRILTEMDEVVVAMSAGVDSVLLAKAAFSILGDRSIAVTADSPSLPRKELKETIEIAQHIGIKHLVIKTDEIQNENYVENPVDRCYFCKNELFDQIDLIKAQTNIKWIVFGENIDDQTDHRPGGVAAREHNVRAPLKEAGLTKEDIRSLARHLQLPNWDKPASACLASRIPYGESVTIEKLEQVEKAEDFLYDLGFRGFRVRHHGTIARVEVQPDDMVRLIQLSEKVVPHFKELGFRFITLDLMGYKRGSLNEGLIQIDQIP